MSIVPREVRMYRVTLAVLLIAVAGCGGSKGWNTKATLDELAASNRVGGFSPDDARLYHFGVQHAINKRQNIGALTIGQVVDQERGREEQRAQAAIVAANRAKDRAEVARARARAAREARIAAEDAHFMHGSPSCLILDERTVHTVSEDYGWAIAGKVFNRCDRSFRYAQVEFAFYDGAGNRENSGIVNINNLEAGETWSFRKRVYETVSGGGKWGVSGITAY